MSNARLANIVPRDSLSYHRSPSHTLSVSSANTFTLSMTQIRDDEGTQQHYSTLEAWNVRESDFPKDGSLS